MLEGAFILCCLKLAVQWLQNVPSFPESVFVQLATKMNWLEFEVKSQDHSNVSKHFGRLLSPLYGMHGRILVKLITVTHYQTFWRSWFKGHGHKQLFQQRHVDCRSTVYHQKTSSLCVTVQVLHCVSKVRFTLLIFVITPSNVDQF